MDQEPHNGGQPSSRKRRRYRWLINLAAAGIAIVLVATGWFLLEKRKLESKRAEWKDQALVRLAGLTSTNEVIQRELNELRAGPTPQINRGWAHDHTLLMTNGEFIVYEFRHGYNIGTIDHLFLGHGSDGRWLYSTYHFCTDMAGARGDEPPGSIAEFMEGYSVREFDGKSAECLEHTWPEKSKRE